MKILLVCAGGMSTGLLMKKMEKYWEERGEDNSEEKSEENGRTGSE